jgi:hypothetical protein
MSETEHDSDLYCRFDFSGFGDKQYVDSFTCTFLGQNGSKLIGGSWKTLTRSSRNFNASYLLKLKRRTSLSKLFPVSARVSRSKMVGPRREVIFIIKSLTDVLRQQSLCDTLDVLRKSIERRQVHDVADPSKALYVIVFRGIDYVIMHEQLSSCKEETILVHLPCECVND